MKPGAFDVARRWRAWWRAPREGRPTPCWREFGAGMFIGAALVVLVLVLLISNGCATAPAPRLDCDSEAFWSLWPASGVRCVWSYAGRVPCTGRLRCLLCGRTHPGTKPAR